MGDAFSNLPNPENRASEKQQLIMPERLKERERASTGKGLKGAFSDPFKSVLGTAAFKGSKAIFRTWSQPDVLLGGLQSQQVPSTQWATLSSTITNFGKHFCFSIFSLRSQS